MFGWFGKKTDTQTIEKHGQRAGNKRAQAPDRWDAIQALASILTIVKKEGADDRVGAVVAALLARFTFYADPTITDQEEKDFAFRVVLDAGAGGVDAIRAFMKRSEALVWPLKMLDRLLSPEEVVTELLALLEDMDLEYQRDPQRKLQVLHALDERRDPRIAAAARRFLEDVNETARFHAVGAILGQDDAADFRAAVVEALSKEESVRVKDRILEAFSGRGWDLGEARGIIEKQSLPSWSFDKAGIPKRA